MHHHLTRGLSNFERQRAIQNPDPKGTLLLVSPYDALEHADSHKAAK
jgi:hypothetical protein